MIKPTNNKDIIEGVRRHQNNKYLHPLTCGNKSTHKLLEPLETIEGEVILMCPDCDYIQNWVPEQIFFWQ